MRSEDTTEVVIIHLSHCSICFPSFWWFPDLVLGHFNATLLENPTLGWFLIWELSIVGYAMKYNSYICSHLVGWSSIISHEIFQACFLMEMILSCELHGITIVIICFLWVTDGKVPFRLEKYLFVYANALISALVNLGTEFISWEHVISLSTTQNEDIWEPQIWIWSRVDHVAGELRQSWAAAVVSCGTNRVVPGIAGSQLAEWGSPIWGISRWFVHRWYHLVI